MTQNSDFSRAISVASSLLPNVRTATTNGSGVDLAGYNAAAVVAHIGTITDGTFAISVEESDDNSTFTSASSSIVGTFANGTSSADDTVQEVSYVGTKRYIRGKVTVTGSPSTGGPIGITVVRGLPRQQPA